MKKIFFFLGILLVLGLATDSFAQKGRAVNLLIVLDSSASMAQNTPEGKQKIEIAKISIAKVIATLSPDLNVGFMAIHGFGSKSDWRRINLLVPVGPLDKLAIWDALAKLRPRGLTPLAEALEKAGDQLQNLYGKSCVLLITDGNENCGGDPVRVASTLAHRYKIDVIIDVIALNACPEDERDLTAIANASGGDFFVVNNLNDLSSVTNKVVEKRVEIITGEDGTLRLNYTAIPSVSNIIIYDQIIDKKAEGSSVWRHFQGDYLTKLRPGKYRLEFYGNFKNSPLVIKDIVINPGKETKVNLETPKK